MPPPPLPPLIPVIKPKPARDGGEAPRIFPCCLPGVSSSVVSLPPHQDVASAHPLSEAQSSSEVKACASHIHPLIHPLIHPPTCLVYITLAGPDLFSPMGHRVVAARTFAVDPEDLHLLRFKEFYCHSSLHRHTEVPVAP